MESPLTTFLYVLMRDHLPTGTVKWLIEQSQLAGEPSYSAPELEALAERYAAELLLAPPRNGAPGAPPAPAPAPEEPEPEESWSPPEGDPPVYELLAHGSVRERVSAYLAWRAMNAAWFEDGEWVAIADVVPAVGKGKNVVRQAMQWLVKEDRAEAKGATVRRRYRHRVKTSEPDHDDAGEGSSPDDPAGETGEGEGASPANPGSDQSGGPRDEATPPVQQPPRDDDGGQSGAPAAAPPSVVGMHVRPGETDVEIMARIGDYVEENPAGVYASEIESLFGLYPERRRTIMGMLEERRRVKRVQGGKGRRYIPRSATTGEADFSIPGRDDGAGETELHLKKPETATVPDPTSEQKQRVLGWAVGQRTFRKRAAQEAFPDLDPGVLGKILTGLAADGALETRAGDQLGSGGVIYAIAGSPIAKNGGKSSTGQHRETLEGRVMAWLDAPKTADQTALHFGINREEAVIVLDRLVGESMVARVRDSASGCTYHPV